MKGIDNKLIGEKIKARRQKLGLTQEQLAEQCEISVSFIAHIERGTKSLSLDTAVKISNAMHISLDYLLFNSANDYHLVLSALDSELANYSQEQIDRFLKIVKILLCHIEEI